MPLKILVFGAPGCGKGTMCDLLVREYGLTHISAGNLLRDEVEKGTPLGREVAARINEGNLITDDIIVDMMVNKLQQAELSNQSVLLDGFPRTINQAIALSNSGCQVDALLYISVDVRTLEERCVLRRLDPVTGRIYNLKSDPPPEEVESRLLIRSDDTREKHQRRMQIYIKQKAALLGHYKGKVVQIDGNPPLQEVFAALKIVMSGLLKQRIESNL